MDEPSQPSAPPGHSAQRLADTLLSTLRNRVELFALDLLEERFWLVSALILGLVCLFFGFAALLLVTLTAAQFAPVKARPYVFLGFTVVYMAVAVVALLRLRRKLKDKPAPFSDTITELKKDIACLRSQD